MPLNTARNASPSRFGQPRPVVVAFRRAVVLMAGCILLAGCAGTQQGRMAKAYLADGEYDRAVRAAKQAVDANPGNPAYLDLLSDAETEAADFHFARAEKLRAEHRPTEALKVLGQALEYMPAHPGANLARAEVGKEIRRCRELTDRAREAVEWEQTALLAQEASAIDRDDPDASRLFEHARMAMAANYLAQAKAALDAGDANGCLEACRRAKKWDPENAYLALLERKASSDVHGAGAEGSPVPKLVSETQPARDVVLKPQPAEEIAKSEVEQAGTVAAKSEAREDVAMKPQSTRDLRAENAPRLPPRLARVEGTGTVAEPPPATERLIEAQPSRTEPVRRPGADREPETPALITVEPGRPRQSPVRAATSRPAEKAAGEPQPVAGVIREARPRTGSASPGENVTRQVSGNAVPPRSGQVARDPVATVSKNSEPRHLFRGALSREDKRYKKQIAIMDGILIKLRDTDGDPVDADFEIVAGKFKVKPDDVPPGGKIEIRGISGRTYVMTVVWIDDDQETVHFSIDRLE